MTFKNDRSRYLVILFLVLGSLIFLFPFLWMLMSSFKTTQEVVSIPPSLLGENMSLDAYARLFQKWDFFTQLKNTIILVLYSFFGILLSAMSGYGFAKYKFKCKNILFILVLSTMMIPAQVNIIPNFILIVNAGLANTLLAMALPALVTGFSIFLFRQFMETIPNEIIEAARVEGLSEFRIFFKVILPMSKPILSIQIILAFVASWNSFLWPLIVAQSNEKYPLTVGLNLLNGQNNTDIPMQMAGSTIMIIPVLIVFFIFQKNILDGANVSGIK